MPYEAAVPVHRRLLWPAVTEPERLLGALPNAVVEASGGRGAAGRLRLRLRDQSVTFRGVARIVEVEAAPLRVVLEVEASFGRAGGTVEGTVELRLRPAGSGTRVVVDGNLTLSGGVPAFPAEALEPALTRLVQRWFAALTDNLPGKRARAADAGPAAEAEAEAEAAPDGPRSLKDAGKQVPETLVKRPKPLRAVAATDRSGLSVVRDLPVAGAEAENSPAEQSSGHYGEDAGPVGAPAQNPADEPVQLRLVPTEPRAEGGDGGPAAPESGGDGPDAAKTPAKTSAEPPPETAAAEDLAVVEARNGDTAPDSPEDESPEDEDLWSRLRPGRLPLNLPGALKPAAGLGLLFTAGALLIALLRRRRRR
jgi:carbon monoxide dehydrogenase subunit G